jgi:hypothetical protein
MFRLMSSLLVLTDHKRQRRSAVRYPLQLPVIFNWQEGETHTGGGFTSDVSLDGALIQSAVCPPMGSELSIEILVPCPDEFREQLRILCSGKVTRVARYFGGYSFGVKGCFGDGQIVRHFAI